MEQAGSDKPRCVLGSFDFSARPHVGRGELTFSIPIQRFVQMLRYMDESFIITNTWEKVKSKLG